MNAKLKRTTGVLSVLLVASMAFGSTAVAADTTLKQTDSAVAMVRETDVPIEVGDLITGTAMGVGTVEALGVNVRVNPNEDAEIVTVLSMGTKVVVLSREGDWYRISCEGVHGFVSCDYMSVEEQGQADLGYGLIKCETANIRSSADTEAEPISALDGDEVVSILGVIDGWYEVDVDGTIGYIRSDLVDPTADIPAEKIYDYAVIGCGAANLRSAPDASAEKVDVLYSSSLCTLLEQDGDWYKVQYGDSVGYVLASLMDTTNDETDGSTQIRTYNDEVEAQKAAAAAAAAAEAARKAAAASSSSSYSSSSSSSSYSSSSSSSSSSGSYSESSSAPSTSGNGSIIDVAKQYMGVPYVWGGTSPSGFDCSGFTQYVFRQCGYSINRTAAAQYNNGSYVSYSNLSPGDLVFFANTYSAGGITHVGIYIGGGQFIHSANGGVKISSLSESYYADRYYGARRIA